jgi:hypothetical protein
LQDLQTFAVGINRNLNAHTVLRRRLEGILSRVITTGRKLESGRIREFERLAIRTIKSIGKGVEGETAAERHSGDDVGGCDKGMRGGVGIIASSEVTVV